MKDVVSTGVYDLFLTRYWGIKLAAVAACTVLRVDQVLLIKVGGKVVIFFCLIRSLWPRKQVDQSLRTIKIGMMIKMFNKCCKVNRTLRVF